MQIPFISTKLQIPTVNHDIVPRPQLLTRMDDGGAYKLTLICAPAGFGKTTLAGYWLAAQKMAKAWLSLYEEDNEPVRFVFYIILALQKGLKSMDGSILQTFIKEQPPTPKDVLTQLINDVDATGQDCVLVLDDFQVITDPAVHNCLKFLLDHQPSNLHLVITSRSEPDLPLARLRANQHMTTIDADDLRFSADESRVLLNQVMALNLNDDEIALLAEHTEGWIAGLQMSALAASGSCAPSKLFGKLSGTDRFITDYFVDEVLSHQTEQIQYFLLHTAIFDQFCAELCDESLEIKGSRSIIEMLEKANMFIFGLDNTRTWYRYHSLFAQVLLSRLEQQNSVKISGLYSRASNWFKKMGRMAEALEYSVKGRNYDQTDAIIEEIIEGFINAPKLISQVDEKAKEISTWLNCLPESQKTSFKVRILQSFANFCNGIMGQSENVFKKILALPLQPTPERYGAFSALFIAIIAYHRHLDGQTTCRYCQTALQLLIKSDNCLLAFLMSAKGYLLLGDTIRAEQCLKDVVAIENRLEQSFHFSPVAWGLLFKARGQLQMALSHYRKGFKELKSGSFLYCYQAVGQAGIYYEYNQLETCRDLLSNIQDTIQTFDFLDLLLQFYQTLIQLHCASSAFEKAARALERAETIVTALDAPSPAFGSQLGQAETTDLNAVVMRRIEVLRANLALKQGDLDQAAQCARAIGTGVKDAVGYDVEPELMALVRFHICQNAFTPAMDLLERMLALANSQKRVDSIIALETLAAKACYLDGDENQALARLEKALRAAQPGGYIRTFVDEGAPIQALMQMLRDQDDHRTWPENLSGYFQMLLQQFGLPNPSAPNEIQPSQKNRDRGGLTRREHQVLKLIVQRLTYEEVAGRLEISANTVKFHIKNIYSKLNVNSRLMAVKRANQKQLL